MKYLGIKPGIFIERKNRFIAIVEVEGNEEVVHVKNTGRCQELLRKGASVYVQRANNPERKTKWDLISVKKGRKWVNIDSQVPNDLLEEWIGQGNLFVSPKRMKREYRYQNSRLDFYIEEGEKKILMEVKGVTLEDNGMVLFPDAPSQRAIRHIEDLIQAKKAGYEAYLFFVVQMKEVEFFIPNISMHPEFSEVLWKAKEAGVQICARDCRVEKDEIEIREEVEVLPQIYLLHKDRNKIVDWYETHHRKLPWRESPNPYKVWVSEIMLQQTRVEAVKGYYERFLKEFPDIFHLAKGEEDRLLKAWEGLGYYNRVRNMQIAAKEMVEKYGGEFPSTYEEILTLKGIGSYTAGAISAFAFGKEKAAVDGNVLRVITRYFGMNDNIDQAKTKKKIEALLEQIIPEGKGSAFGQGLIEIGATVCLPNGWPQCQHCPLKKNCIAKKEDRIGSIPQREKAKARRVERRTVFLFRDGEHVAIQKRGNKGLLAGLYEFPNVEGHLSLEEGLEYARNQGLLPIQIKKLEEGRHIFSHIEWNMIGYEIRVDELEKRKEGNHLFVSLQEIEEVYSIPSAFETYTNILKQGWRS